MFSQRQGGEVRAVRHPWPPTRPSSAWTSSRSSNARRQPAPGPDRRRRGGAAPGRVVEQLDIDRLGTGGGGIHCVTQQQPVP
ncbi:agmatine deiminase family protein [Streptomyces yangpuensis]|uniref:agmatine deiminase family protein n=1 Tax=Streptomyces yangpuensis TaxID=1648182 RepID=UPI0036415EEB